jgi:hypothetical protein
MARVKVIDRFFSLHRGISSVINAADIYLLHIVASYNKTEVNSKLIDQIIKERRMTSYTAFGWQYNDDILKILEDKGYIRHICQLILLQTYTALEVYLIGKFEEYYRFLLERSSDTSSLERIPKKFSTRNLEDIKRNYKLIDIHLPLFELNNIYTADGCNFRPKSCWDGLKLIEKARNEIAHRGETTEYKLITLMDAWYPFEFVTDWVTSFDVHFDEFIFKSTSTPLMKKYIASLSKIKK